MCKAERATLEHEITVLRRRLDYAQVAITQKQNQIDVLVEQGNAHLTEQRELQAATIASDDMMEATLSELGAVRKQLDKYKRLNAELRTALTIEGQRKQHYKTNMYRAMYGLPLLDAPALVRVRETSEGLEAP